MEFGFYFGDLPDKEALRRIVSSLVSLGARFSGEAGVHVGPDAQEPVFSSPTDFLQESVTIESLEDVDSILEDRSKRLVSLGMEGASATTKNTVSEIVTFARISSQAAGLDNHPIAIWTDGDLFTGYGDSSKKLRLERTTAGKKAYRRMIDIVRLTNPTYATLTVEQPIPCLYDLRADSRYEHSFGDFFINCAHFPGIDIVIKDLYKDAYIEAVNEGLYVSTNADANPKHRNLDQRNRLAAELIKHLRRTRPEFRDRSAWHLRQ